MLPKEIFKKIRKIEMTTRRLVNDTMAGEYHSIFKGRGMEFAEVREYFQGDDIRTVDWNVSARMGSPFVKVFDEERELTVFLMVDASASGHFGSGEQFKSELAAEVCAVLAFSAITNKDRVGLIIFTDEIEKFVPPKKGRRHVLRVIRELLFFKPRKRGTDIGKSLDYLQRVWKRRSIVFLVSDFLTEAPFEKQLRVLSSKHDLIAVPIVDRRETELPASGWVALEDPESGETLVADTGNPRLRELFRLEAERERQAWRELFLRLGIDSIELRTDESYFLPLVNFFRKRYKAALRHT